MKKASIIIIQLFCLVVFLSFTADAQSNCTYSYTRTPSETAFPGVPLTITVTATTQPGCVWSTMPNYEASNTNFSWVTFPEGNSRTGSGTITIEFSRNPGVNRGVTFTFPGNYGFFITQAKDCSFPSPTNQAFSAAGGTGRIDIVFPHSDCGINGFQSSDSWIIPIAPSYTGPGSASRQFQVAPNNGPARTGTVTVLTAQWATSAPNLATTITINQAAGQSNCTYTLTRNYTTPLPKSGGNYSINVNTQEGCAWTVENNTPWIVITSGSSGTGNGTISFTLQQNTSGTRGATISVAGQSVSILQSGGCVYTPMPASINVPSNGGQGSFTINHSEGCANFDVDYIHNPWIKVVNITREGTLITFFYTVDENLGEARTGTIKFSDPFSPPGGIFTVNQAGRTNCTYSINPTSIQAGVAGGDTGFNITTETGCNWTAQSNASWITVSNTTGSGAGRVNYSIQSNTGAARQGTITAGGQTFTINQDAVAAPVELIRASGRVIDASFKSIRGAIVSFTNLATGETRTTTTNHFGYFHFANIERGQPYSIAISHKRYKFTPRTVIYNTGALIPIYNPDPEP